MLCQIRLPEVGIVSAVMLDKIDVIQLDVAEDLEAVPRTSIAMYTLDSTDAAFVLDCDKIRDITTVYKLYDFIVACKNGSNKYPVFCKATIKLLP